MKVFLSWSGEVSHQIACALRDWLPQILNKVVPYVSSEDIDKGERWATDIGKELEASSFGVIAVTPANLSAPWIHFEAGALSKTVDRSNVVPFLFGLKRSEVTGPLLQFQSVVYEKDDLEKLVLSINRRLPDDDRRGDAQLKTAFEVWWPHLKEKLDALNVDKEPKAAPEAAEQRKPTALLEEVLDLVRSQQKLLRSPENLLPPAYIAYAVRRAGRPARDLDRLTTPGAEELHDTIMELKSSLRRQAGPESAPSEIVQLQKAVNRLHDQFYMRFRDELGPRQRVGGRALAAPAKKEDGAEDA